MMEVANSGAEPPAACIYRKRWEKRRKNKRNNVSIQNLLVLNDSKQDKNYNTTQPLKRNVP